MKYQQLSAEERVVIATLRKQGMSAPQIGREMGGASEHGVEGVETQPRALRWRVPQRASARAGGSQAQAFAAQPAVWESGAWTS